MKEEEYIDSRIRDRSWYRTRRLSGVISAGLFILVAVISALACIGYPAFAKTIHVPADSATIQAGIDGTVHGDTVLVTDGIYTGEGNKNLDFLGKAIVVRSENGPEVTVIDCENYGRGFIFQNDEGNDSKLEGFTVLCGCGDYGGGILCEGSSPRINRCIIKENFAHFGGGIFCLYSHAGFSQCVISDNRVHTGDAPEAAGGGLCSVNSSLSFFNCMIINNQAEASAWPPFQHWAWGGGLCCESATLTNCTLSRNSASAAPGGIYCQGSTDILNCILWQNSGGEIGLDYDGDAIVRHSNIQGGWPGEGNIDIDPLFRDPENGDYHLMVIECGDSLDSPCIDAGDPVILDDVLDCWHGLGTSRSDMGTFGGANAGWPTAVEEKGENASVPAKFQLFQNYPNPFNSETLLRFHLANSDRIKIIVYNVLGQELHILLEGFREAGEHRVIWDASGFPSGIYFARLETEEYSQTIKMVMLR